MAGEPHPAYTKDTLPTVVARKFITSGDVMTNGDVEKAVAKIYELTQLETPPLHIPLGKDALAAFRTYSAAVTGDVNKYESWSDNLTVDQ